MNNIYPQTNISPFAPMQQFSPQGGMTWDMQQIPVLSGEITDISKLFLTVHGDQNRSGWASMREDPQLSSRGH